MSEESRGSFADGSEDTPRWRIVEVVPLPTAPPPALPTPDCDPVVDTQQHTLPAPSAPSSARPHHTSAQHLWGELDALLMAPPVGEPLASSGVPRTARNNRSRRLRRLRRLRRIGLAAILGAILGTAVWWWAPPPFQHQLHPSPFQHQPHTYTG